jgi:hypothetical protein
MRYGEYCVVMIALEYSGLLFDKPPLDLKICAKRAHTVFTGVVNARQDMIACGLP